MKAIFHLLTVLCTVAAIGQDNEMILSGTIKNAKADTLFIKSGAFLKAIVPDRSGKFNELISAPMGLYDLYYGDYSGGVFVKNGYNVEMNADADSFEESLTYTGKGETENNYLAFLSNEAAASRPDFYKKSMMLYRDLEPDFHASMRKETDSEGKKREEAKRAREEAKKLEGNLSPQFEYVSSTGKKVKLKKFKGKFVYIDVWATWCAPCKKEIPHLKKIEEAYKSKDIVFASISIDRKKDFEKWKQATKQLELGGMQLFADNDWNSDFIKAYGIKSIPRFILIGPDGTVINADAPRPSDPNLKVLLDSLLK